MWHHLSTECVTTVIGAPSIGGIETTETQAVDLIFPAFSNA